MASAAPRVLIVDDSAFMRFMLQKILADAGFDVVGEATDGTEGAELFRSLRPDVVTMDITMPVLSGLEGLKRILGIDPEARVIMISAMGQKSTVLKALQSGALGFIIKPFDKTKVVDTVWDVLAFSRRGAPPAGLFEPSTPGGEDGS